MKCIGIILSQVHLLISGSQELIKFYKWLNPPKEAASLFIRMRKAMK